MKLTELQALIGALDEAYERIESEYGEPSHAAPWDSFYYQGAEPGQSVTTAADACGEHAGEAHGIAGDAFSGSFAQELSGWVRLAQRSDTARGILGVDRFGDQLLPSDRLGGITSVLPDGDVDLRLAASRDLVGVSERGGALWERTPRSDFNLWTKDRGARASNAAGRYDDWLARQDEGARLAAPSRIGDCPPAKLLGGAVDDGAARYTPMAYSESWLDDARIAADDRLWATPCQACEIGMSDWACGRDELVGKLSDAAKARYAAAGDAWMKFLKQDGSRSRRALRAPDPKAAASGLRSRSLVVPIVGGAPSAADRARSAALPASPARPSGAAPSDGAAPSAPRGAPSDRSAATTRSGQAPAARPAPGGSPGLVGGLGEDAGRALERSVGGAGGPAATGGGAAQAGSLVGGALGVARSAVATANGPATPQADPPLREELHDRFAEAAIAATTGSRYASDPLRGGGAGGDRHQSIHVRLELGGQDTSFVEVREIRGREAISQLFEFELLVICPTDFELTVDAALGMDAAIVFERGTTEVRRVCGMIAEIVDRHETESEWHSYRLFIVPRAWRTTLVKTQEVHLDTTVPDLITKKLSLVGIDEVDMRLRETYPMRELIVQYKETDHAFLSRLAEHLGICFFFECGEGVDKLVFSDDNSGFRALDLGEVPFRRRGDQKDIFEFESYARAFPARYAEQDYNYRTPTVDLTSIHDEPAGFGGGNVEYGAHYRAPEEGVKFARLRAEEQVVSNRYARGRSDVAELVPGGTFKMTGHPQLDGKELLVVEVEHHAVQATKLHAGKNEPYSNRFRTADAESPYRPPRVTQRPRIHGVLTAVVEPDPSGVVAESAVLDEEGRYTVLFYFDAADVAGRAKHSRPVRMIQAHSGPNYGIHFPLKPGIEVLIVFMDGDPDRPMILGSVPNPITPTPVNSTVNLMNRIETTSGLIIEMRDAVPPLAK